MHIVSLFIRCALQLMEAYTQSTIILLGVRDAHGGRGPVVLLTEQPRLTQFFGMVGRRIREAGLTVLVVLHGGRKVITMIHQAREAVCDTVPTEPGPFRDRPVDRELRPAEMVTEVGRQVGLDGVTNTVDKVGT